MRINKKYLDLLNSRVVVFDGAMGTNLDRLKLSASDYGGQDFIGCNDYLNLSCPDAVSSVHESFLKAGVDVIETNTFRSNRLTLSEFGLADRVFEINLAAARNARRCVKAFSEDSRPRLVAGSIGPTGVLLTLTDESNSLSNFDDIRAIFCEQTEALLTGGVDLILLETQQDILELKAAILGVQDAIKKSEIRVPIQAQVTVDANGHMLAGTDMSAASAILAGMQIDVLGVNCSTGPKEMRASLDTLDKESPLPISCLPNAGIPENRDGKAVYTLSPSEFTDTLVEFTKRYSLSAIGGCCGTTPDHLSLLVDRLGIQPAPKRTHAVPPRLASSFNSIQMQQDPPPFIIGERLNVQGSRHFKKMLINGDFDLVVPIAEDQMRFGAHALDISTALTEIEDEAGLMKKVLSRLAGRVDAAFVIDSTNPDVLETALKITPGRCLINSINLESGEDRARRVLSQAKDFNAAVIGLTIDENGMAKTALEKLSIARRLYTLAVKEYGLLPGDLVIDPLTFTLGSGSAETVNAGSETIKALQLIHEEIPGVLTCLGISNISFGLSSAARKVTNSIFLFHAVKHGLDMAILNPAQIQPYPDIPSMERQFAEDLIFNARSDALERLINHFSGKVEQEAISIQKPLENYSLEERIFQRILKRDKVGLENDLDAYIRKYGKDGEKLAALSAVNEVLLPAMQEVGRLFAKGELILPFVLGSAEVMQAATDHLEPYLSQEKSTKRGTLLLATVYGDVHDIGKNLVRTILSNNGYEVIDLGKQVPVERIITTAVEQKVDAIGLSALLVSTSQQMPLVIEGLRERGLRIPVLIGGAAVNADFARRMSIGTFNNNYSGGVYFCKDAFDALKELDNIKGNRGKDQKIVESFKSNPIRKSKQSRKMIDLSAHKIPDPPFWGAHIMNDIPFNDLFNNLNKPSLFRISWGVKNARGKKWKEYKKTFEKKLSDFRKQLEEHNWINPAAAYGYFPCAVEGDDLLVQNSKNNTEKTIRFHLPRQKSGEQRSLADYFLPAGYGNPDLAIFQIVTMGERSAAHIRSIQEELGISEAYFAHGLAVGLTEAAAKWLHAFIRNELKIQPKHGKRYSWGYPALPDLSQHEQLFQLLPAKQIGINLTSAFQFIPEYTTAALVLHHPQAEYFSMD